jgi:hypothetical protein
MVESGAATTTGEATPTPPEAPQDKQQKKSKFLAAVHAKRRLRQLEKQRFPV